MSKEKRPVRVEFQLTEDEMKTLKQRMNRLGIENMSAFIRQMVLFGYMFSLNTVEIREMISLLRYTGNNLNQIAKRINATGRLYEQEISEILTNQQRIWNGVNEILEKLGSMLNNNAKPRI